MRIDSSDSGDRLTAARSIYAEDWQSNAANLESQNGYDWMASQIESHGPKRILDIGCGTGNGIVALLNRFPDAKIISLDENPQIIRIAKKFIESRGSIANVVGRLKHTSTSERSHSLSHAPNQLRLRKGVDLVESDMLNDSELEIFLSEQNKFDVITVWQIGSHLLRYHECDEHSKRIGRPINYRWEVQARAFYWATGLLKSGGALHIVDRGPPPVTDESRDAILEPLRGFAAGTKGKVRIDSLDFRTYSEADPGKSVKIVDDSGQIVSFKQLALISVTAIRT